MSDQAEILKQAVHLMQKHDFFFDYSEDQNVWMRGNGQKFEILQLVRKLPNEVLPRLLEQVPPTLLDHWAVVLEANIGRGL